MLEMPPLKERNINNEEFIRETAELRRFAEQEMQTRFAREAMSETREDLLAAKIPLDEDEEEGEREEE